MNELLIYIASFLHAYIRILTPGGAKALAAENAALRHQLAILTRGRKRAPNLELRDRVLLGLMVDLIKSHRIGKIAALLKPKTLLKFHQDLVKQKYQNLYSSASTIKPGPKDLPQTIINAVIQMKQMNPSFGCRKIAHMVNHTFELAISHQQVYRILIKHDLIAPDEGPSWLSFLGNLKDSLWSVDFFRCESATLTSHWVMVVMDQFSRRIVGFAVHVGNPCGLDACRMFREIIRASNLPTYLSSDHDPLFEFHQWQANLRILEIDEIKTIPNVPLSHPYIERLIGTIRREYLDKTLFWNKRDLTKKLNQFKAYYNAHRTHYALDGRTPFHQANFSEPKPLDIEKFRWKPLCRGLFNVPDAL